MKLLTVSALLCALMALNSAVVKSRLVRRSSGCPRGWTVYRNRCFRYISNHLTWVKAERNCLSLGGNLASIHNIWDEHRIWELSGKRPAWIGGHDAVQEGFWFWSDGSPFDYSNWCPGEPNNSFFQHCLQISYKGAKCYDDVRCYYHLPSVCARKKQ